MIVSIVKASENRAAKSIKKKKKKVKGISVH